WIDSSVRGAWILSPPGPLLASSDPDEGRAPQYGPRRRRSIGRDAGRGQATGRRNHRRGRRVPSGSARIRGDGDLSQPSWEPPMTARARHCLACGARLTTVRKEGRRRRRCPRCGWTFYDNPTPAAVAIVEGRGGILLAR